MISYFIYTLTVLKSKYIRDGYLAKNGFKKTAIRFPRYGGKKLYAVDKAHEYMYERIVEGKPFMAGRFGSIEIVVPAKNLLRIKYGLNENIKVFCNNAGFFPNDSNLIGRYTSLMLDSMKECDVQGMWYLVFEDYFMKKYLRKDTIALEARYLEPWFAPKPWTRALKNKKVLVIHPFTESIEYQYNNNREKIFPHEDYLPEFELYTLKAVQTIAGEKDDRFETWFDALNYMTEKSLEIDFDVALIGCGAYGYPLAANLKNAGKQAIHLGGVLQTMFGIKGNRWETDADSTVRDLYNEYWIRPNETELPKNRKSIENGCYW